MLRFSEARLWRDVMADYLDLSPEQVDLAGARADEVVQMLWRDFPVGLDNAGQMHAAALVFLMHRFISGVAPEDRGAAQSQLSGMILEATSACYLDLRIMALGPMPADLPQAESPPKPAPASHLRLIDGGKADD